MATRTVRSAPKPTPEPVYNENFALRAREATRKALEDKRQGRR